MNGGLRTIFLGYGSASLLQGVVGFIAVPFLILVLGQQGFAYWAMLEPLVAALAGLALLGAHYGQLYGVTSNTLTPNAALRQILERAWTPALPIIVVGAVAICLFMGLGNQIATVALCALYVTAECTILIFQFHSRAISDAMTFAATVWVRSLCVLAGLLAIRWSNLHLELAHYLAFMVSVDFITLSVIVARYRPNMRKALASLPGDPSTYWATVSYGLPITLAAILAMLTGNADRYVVHTLMDSAQLPSYMVMVKLAGAMSFAMAPINLWWPVARNRYVQMPDGGQAFFSAALQVLLAYYFMAAACLWLAAEYLLPWYAPGISGFDRVTFFFLLMGSVALSMSTPINIGMLAPGKTRILVVTVGFSATVAIGLAALLVPKLGYLGAGCAALGAQVVNLLFTHWASQRICSVSFKYWRLTALCVLAGLMFAVLYWQHGSAAIQLLTLAVAVALYAYFLRNEVHTIAGKVSYGLS